MNYQYGTVLEYWHGRTEVLGKKPVPLNTTSSHGLVWDRTQASEVRGQRLTTSAMARPTFRYGICQYILWEEQE